MRIAAITICYNDDYKYNEWKENYQFYKDSLYKLIIIDNGSKTEFVEKVKSDFSDATLILNERNEGVTISYNLGIKLALEDKEVDAIMLIGNDIKITNESVGKLYEELFKEDEVGMVAPVLLNKDSDIVADAGATISYCFYMKPDGVGKKYEEIEKCSKYVESVTGGMNLSKREFYEAVGLQDERIFMYSDEVDMGFRARQKGYKMLIVGEACAWHQHINPKNRERRPPYSDYLMARNKVYLGRKFFGNVRAFIIFFYMIMKGLRRLGVSLLRGKSCEAAIYAMRGAWAGICGKMGTPEKMRLTF